ncbi:MAG: T9SS type A sorting domain-containing protein [Ignavibacteria bacterium]
MKTIIIKYIFSLTLLLTLTQESNSQGTYFNNADFVYLRNGNPDNIDSVKATDKRTIYWDLSSIDTNTHRLDICIAFNELISGPSSDYLWGNWLKNENNQNFNYENSNFRFIYSELPAITDSITGLCFISLRENEAKDIIVLKSNGVMEIRKNEGKIQVSGEETISQVYGRMPVTGFFSTDTLQDVAIIAPTGIRIFKGVGGSTPPLEDLFFLQNYVFKRISLAQINKHYGPYAVIKNETYDRDEIIAHYGNNIYIFNNNNNNTTNSSPTTTIEFSELLADFKIADVNNDGYNDIISITQYELPLDFTTYSRVSFFLNNSGTINTTPDFTIAGIRYSNSLVFADFNKDGWNDMVIDIGTDTIALFLNTKNSILFSNSPSESFQFESAPGPFYIPPLFANKIETVDLYNKGGIGVIMSGWIGITSAEKYEAMIRINASDSDAVPAPAYLFRDVVQSDTIYHPKLLLFNRGDRDFLKYRIYKKNWVTYHYYLFDSTTSDEYIDTTEDLIYVNTDPVDPPPDNLFYYAVAVDNSNKVSITSDTISYVGYVCPFCQGEIGPDNIIVSNVNNDLPKEYSLSNYPNPFNPSTNIKFDLPKDVLVSIKIYDMLGREIRTLVNDFKTTGSYTISFNGADLSSGIYYYKIKAGDFEQVRKMMLLK